MVFLMGVMGGKCLNPPSHKHDQIMPPIITTLYKSHDLHLYSDIHYLRFVLNFLFTFNVVQHYFSFKCLLSISLVHTNDFIGVFIFVVIINYFF